MSFDFDTPVELRGAHAQKYDSIPKTFGTSDTDVIPMWVADMDFRAAPAIRDALQAEIDRGYFGYFANVEPVNQAVADWMQRRHGWRMEPSWIRYTHGVVKGFGDVLAAFSEPGEAVIVFSPVYHAFFRQARAMGRKIVESPLVEQDGRFFMDLEALERSLRGHERIITLCSPHNPGGRLWTADEIRAVAAFARAHDLVLISDEIHGDLTFPGARFLPTAVAAPDCLDRLVVLTAASKAFNIAGGETGVAIVPDTGMRQAMDKVMLDRESTPNRFAMAMIAAAYSGGADWLDAVRAYLAGNFRLLAERLRALPGVRVMEMEATYLAWVDFSGTGIEDKELLRRFVAGARVAPSPGPQFGTGGSGHLRLNVALPRPTLETAIGRIEAAFSDLQ